MICCAAVGTGGGGAEAYRLRAAFVRGPKSPSMGPGSCPDSRSAFCTSRIRSGVARPGFVDSEVAVAGWTRTGPCASPTAAYIRDADITSDAQQTIPRLADRIDCMAVTSAAVEGCIRYATDCIRCEQVARAHPPDGPTDSQNVRTRII